MIYSKPKIVYWIANSVIVGSVLFLAGCVTRPTATQALTGTAQTYFVKKAQQHYTLAHNHMTQRHYDLAISSYAQGLLFLFKYKAECKSIYCSPGKIHLMSKLFAMGYQEIARAEYLTGRYSSSLKDFRRALNYDQYNAKTHYYLALIFVHQRQHDLVHQEHMILSKLDPILAKRIEKYLRYY